MTDIFDFSPKVDDYAVMGNPITHSKSPLIHAQFAEQTQQALNYTAMHVDLGSFEQAVSNFAASGGKGLNITVPFKQQAWALADERSQRAERAGAVNTLIFKDKKIIGDNTDGVGLVRDLLENKNLELAGRRILLMGAGGAARGVLLPLLNQQPLQLTIVNRTAEKAKDLADAFSDMGELVGCGYDALAGQSFDLLINATAASLQGQLPPLADGIIAAGGACYDMMYSKEPTTFMRWCQQQGADKVYDGLGMLVEQAAESFYLWRGVRPQTREVIESLRQAIK